MNGSSSNSAALAGNPDLAWIPKQANGSHRIHESRMSQAVEKVMANYEESLRLLRGVDIDEDTIQKMLGDPDVPLDIEYMLELYGRSYFGLLSPKEIHERFTVYPCGKKNMRFGGRANQNLIPKFQIQGKVNWSSCFERDGNLIKDPAAAAAGGSADSGPSAGYQVRDEDTDEVVMGSRTVTAPNPSGTGTEENKAKGVHKQKDITRKLAVVTPSETDPITNNSVLHMGSHLQFVHARVLHHELVVMLCIEGRYNNLTPMVKWFKQRNQSGETNEAMLVDLTHKYTNKNDMEAYFTMRDMMYDFPEMLQLKVGVNYGKEDMKTYMMETIHRPMSVFPFVRKWVQEWANEDEKNSSAKRHAAVHYRMLRNFGITLTPSEEETFMRGDHWLHPTRILTHRGVPMDPFTVPTVGSRVSVVFVPRVYSRGDDEAMTPHKGLRTEMLELQIHKWGEENAEQDPFAEGPDGGAAVHSMCRRHGGETKAISQYGELDSDDDEELAALAGEVLKETELGKRASDEDEDGDASEPPTKKANGQVLPSWTQYRVDTPACVADLSAMCLPTVATGGVTEITVGQEPLQSPGSDAEEDEDEDDSDTEPETPAPSAAPGKRGKRAGKR